MAAFCYFRSKGGLVSLQLFQPFFIRFNYFVTICFNYTPKIRPSGHDIGKGFGKDNGGAIPSNLIQISNTESNGTYLDACKIIGAKQHPARFPTKLPEFFIKMLTDPGDTVLDIFSGSNTTGQVAETEGRRWLAFELLSEYVGPISIASQAFQYNLLTIH